MRLHIAHLLMRSPHRLWLRYPERLKHWAVDQHMLTYASVRRLRGLDDSQ